MVRNPAQVLVSQAAWFSFCWNYFASPAEPYPFRNELFEMTRHWYSYPLELLKSWESSDYLIVEYSNLISRPIDTITGLYRHFNLPLSDEYRSWLEEESQRTDEYASAHRLSLEDVGYNPETVKKHFTDIYEGFDFSNTD